MSTFDDMLFPGRRKRPEPQIEGPVEGVVRSVEAGGIRFTIPNWDGKYLFGPAPWNKALVEPTSGHDHDPTPPPVGAKCLVVFVGVGIDRPWIVGWWAP